MDQRIEVFLYAWRPYWILRLGGLIAQPGIWLCGAKFQLLRLPEEDDLSIDDPETTAKLDRIESVASNPPSVPSSADIALLTEEYHAFLDGLRGEAS